jgi:hypothetical protein
MRQRLIWTVYARGFVHFATGFTDNQRVKGDESMDGVSAGYRVVFMLFAILAFGKISVAAELPKKAASAPGTLVQKTESQKEIGKWDEFRGIKWGADITSLTGFETNPMMQGVGNYWRKDEKLTLGGATLRGILWRFYKGKLYHVVVTGENGTFPAVKAATESRYGKSYQDTSDKYREAYTWAGTDSDGKKITVEVSRDKETETVSCFFTYVPLEEQEYADAARNGNESKRKADADFKEKAQKGAKEDF